MARVGFDGQWTDEPWSTVGCLVAIVACLASAGVVLFLVYLLIRWVT